MRNPKHILITGASSGIGAALANLYAAPGVRLSLHGRNEERACSASPASPPNGAPKSTTLISGDYVTDAGDLAAWIALCDAAQPIDLVIANAGVSAGTGTGKVELLEQSWRIFSVNLEGVFKYRPSGDEINGGSRTRATRADEFAGRIFRHARRAILFRQQSCRADLWRSAARGTEAEGN